MQPTHRRRRRRGLCVETVDFVHNKVDLWRAQRACEVGDELLLLEQRLEEALSDRDDDGRAALASLGQLCRQTRDVRRVEGRIVDRTNLKALIAGELGRLGDPEDQVALGNIVDVLADRARFPFAWFGGEDDARLVLGRELHRPIGEGELGRVQGWEWLDQLGRWRRGGGLRPLGLALSRDCDWGIDTDTVGNGHRLRSEGRWSRFILNDGGGGLALLAARSVTDGGGGFALLARPCSRHSFRRWELLA
mmetsp:Transcript_59453/g.118126  ORF Transcript_59453/g.118126 Transcript_59453/m.118126 type:complete len:249 (-) Transcript_59453:326-1072(-)